MGIGLFLLGEERYSRYGCNVALTQDETCYLRVNKALQLFVKLLILISYFMKKSCVTLKWLCIIWGSILVQPPLSALPFAGALPLLSGSGLIVTG